MIGKNIKYYRLMNHLSQEELAQQVGLNKMAISNYEMDKRTPDLATLRKIADALNVTLAKLTVSSNELNIVHGAFRKHSSITKTTAVIRWIRSSTIRCLNACAAWLKRENMRNCFGRSL